MECKQYNGKYGCPYCYNPGRRVNDPTSDDDKKGGWKYPFSVSEEDAQNNPEDIIELYEERIIRKDYRERTEEEVLNQMIQAAENQLDVTIKEKDKTVKGFSGLTSMSANPFFNVLWGFPPDSLHLLQGIFQRVFFPSWFDEVRSGCYIGSPSLISLLNRRITSIRLSKQIHRKPRSISLRNVWKASECKSFLLYFGIPCLSGILKKEYVDHFSCLVEGISLLMQSVITIDDLERSQVLLDEFVREVERLYGVDKMMYNVHILRHLPKATYMCGPLWTFSMYVFESKMLTFKKCIHSAKGVCIQVTEKIARMESLSHLKRHFKMSETAFSLGQRMSLGYASNVGIALEDNSVVLGKGKLKKLSRIEQLLLGVNQDVVEVESYFRVIINGVSYSTAQYTRTQKSLDSIVELRDERFGKITEIFVINNQCHLIVESIATSEVLCGNTKLSHIRRVCPSNFELRHLRPKAIIGQCHFIQIDVNTSYVCRLLGTAEVQ